MKLIKTLALLLVALALIGCASTESTDGTDTDQVKKQASEKSGSLVDRYISGEIPGYKDQEDEE